jgi:hypothetical protein
MARARHRLPKGITEPEVRDILEHYENQTEAEAVAEDEAAFGRGLTTVMEIPTELVPDVLALLNARRPEQKRARGIQRRKSA